MSATPIHPGVRMGHVHLKVADLERSLAFYHGVLGLDVTLRFGNTAAFLSAGGYHHHLGLNTWESLGGKPPAPGTNGTLPPRTRLPYLRRVRRRPAPPAPGEDPAQRRIRSRRQRSTLSARPDQNGVELYWDRPRDQWPFDAAGNLTMYTRALDLKSLLQEADTLL